MKRISVFGMLLWLSAVIVLGNFLQAQQAAPGIAAPPTQPVSPNVISFADTLANQPDGATTVTFTLYPDQQSTTPTWTETQVVQVSQSKYTALLGSTTPEGIPPGVFAADQARWLGVAVNGTEKRYLLVSVPYAMKAMDAERLGGLTPSEYATVQQLQAALANSTAGSATSGRTASGPTASGGPVAAASSNPPQPATNFTDNNTSEVLLVTQQGTGFAIHAVSAGDAALFAENSTATGTALKAVATGTTGANIGLLGQSASSTGIAGVFDNIGSGQILSLRSNGTEVASVDNSGNFKVAQITASTFVGSGFGLTNVPNTATSATPSFVNNTIVSRDQNGNFSAGQITATNFVGGGFGLTNIPNSATTATPSFVNNTIVSRDQNGNFSAGQITATNFVGGGFGLTNIPNSATTATPSFVNNAIVARDQNGNFSAGQITANNFVGNGFGLTNILPSAIGATSNNTPNTVVQRDPNGNIFASAVLANFFSGNGGGLSGIQNSATTATNNNTPNTIVARDASGNFAAGAIVANNLSADGIVSGGLIDFSAASGTAPVRAVLSANTPATCESNRELLIKTDATPGQQLFICNASGNGYLLVGDGTAAGVTSVGAGDSSVTVGGTAVVPTIAVANGGITSAKLAANAVTSANIANGSITNSQLAANAVNSANIADGSLSAAKIAGTAATLGANTFTGSQTLQQDLTVSGNLSAGVTNISGKVIGAPLVKVTQSGSGVALLAQGPGAGVTALGGDEGLAAQGNTYGVNANSTNGIALNALSTSSYGVFSSSTNAIGLHSDGATVGGDFSSGSGVALQATTNINGGVPAIFTAQNTSSARTQIMSGRVGIVNLVFERFSLDTDGNLFNAGATISEYPGSASPGFVVTLAGDQFHNPASVFVMPAGGTSGAIGISFGAGSASGTVRVATSGTATCLFDNQTTAGHYVGIARPSMDGARTWEPPILRPGRCWGGC